LRKKAKKQNIDGKGKKAVIATGSDSNNDKDKIANLCFIANGKESKGKSVLTKPKGIPSTRKNICFVKCLKMIY